MSLVNLGTRHPITVTVGSHVSEVAQLMAAHDVGAVVVMNGKRPVGIVTDRDLVLRVMNRGLSPAGTRVDAVMSSDLECLSADRPPLAAAEHMRERGIRRLPILGQDGTLIGIVTHDDLVRHFGASAGELGEALAMPAAKPRRI